MAASLDAHLACPSSSQLGAQGISPPCLAAARGQSGAPIDLSDASDRETGAAIRMTRQPASHRKVSRTPPEKARLMLRQQESSSRKRLASPKQRSGLARGPVKPSHLVTARVAPALALLRTTAATLYMAQAEGVRTNTGYHSSSWSSQASAALMINSLLSLLVYQHCLEAAGMGLMVPTSVNACHLSMDCSAP